MDAMLKIQGANAQSVRASGEVIIRILKTGHEQHTEQETIRAALETLSRVAMVRNVSINNNMFTNGAQPSTAPAFDKEENLPDEDDDETETTETDEPTNDDRNDEDTD